MTNYIKKKQGKLCHVRTITVFLIIFIISIMPNITLLNAASISNINGNTPIAASMTSEEPGNYVSSSNVTYELEYNWTLWTVSSSITAETWIPRLQNQTHEYFPGQAPLQFSTLETQTSNYNDYFAGTGIYHYDEADEFNNSYDYYKINLSPTGENFEYSAKYQLTLHDMEWDISNLAVNNYNAYLSESWYLNLTGPEDKFNTADPDLITLSNSICNGLTTINDKAKAIYDWIEENITYSIQHDDNGASSTYDNLIGDCSDYSSIMITLLRIQGIPARRIVGLAFLDKDNVPYTNPKTGDSYNYVYYKTTGDHVSNLTQHAWVEYYAPGAGFIVCDPTWADNSISGMNYFNKIDYIHLIGAVGQNFGTGIEFCSSTLSEFPLHPLFASTNNVNIRWRFSLTVTVLEANIGSGDGIDFYMFLAIFIIGTAAVAVIYVLIKPKRAKEDYY